MGVEIERKFLLRNNDWQQAVVGEKRLRQGFLSTDPERTLRVRLADGQGTLTIKGLTRGSRRLEFDYPIPAEEAARLLDELCLRPLIEKIRYEVPYAGMLWEIDVFSGVNAGLVVAEVELSDEGQVFTLPPWVGDEVTGDPRYYNANLIRRPFSSWAKAD
ncbi:CYTH domain-containing protein [Geoalkalibacter sp.]|uniref:CYTH domain-containing protein n=1 Tax=Geoalkalibacter sp. TaxID=3041440 RepID=UPI00272E9F32|nr:CYTH domain-containing protein [Geoalkalibacter sp.]